MTIKLLFQHAPVAQGRPRFASRGKFMSAYDPPKSRIYKRLLAYEAKQQYHGEPLTGDLSVIVKIYRPIQQSSSKRTKMLKQAGIIRPTVKPDADNYYKAVSDALTGIVWVDDSQITKIAVEKYYDDGQGARAEIEIKALD